MCTEILAQSGPYEPRSSRDRDRAMQLRTRTRGPRAVLLPILGATMDILFVTPSLTPYPVEAGPAEASAALAKALRNLGHRVSICAPYPDEPDASLTGLARRLDPLTIDVGGRSERVNVHDGRSAAGIEWTLLEHPSLVDLYEEGEAGLYAQTVLARSCSFAGRARVRSNAVHCHGEETALRVRFDRARERLSTCSAGTRSRLRCASTRASPEARLDPCWTAREARRC